MNVSSFLGPNPRAERVLARRNMPSSQVTWVVSPNGLGHARRAQAVAAALVVRAPSVRVAFVAEAWQRERLAASPSGLALAAHGATWHPGLVADAPRWPHKGGQLLAWRERLAASGVLDAATLVISDNLPGVLALRPDAILEGSFLWSEVLAAAAAAGDADAARFCDDERAVLAAHRPPMLCVADLATPGVRAETRAHLLGWMVEPESRTPRAATAAHGPVAILGGASGALDAALAALAAELVAAGVPVVLSAEVAAQPGAPAAPRFGFAPADFAAARLVICRAGVGTLTDAVAVGTPLVLLPEPAHPEMAHNVARLVDLGCARALPSTDRTMWLRALLADGEALAAMTAACARLDTTGLTSAVDILLDRLAPAVKEPS